MKWQIAEVLDEKGALVYMDGANVNALTDIARPRDFGVDVMHLNLYKTFSMPHGGGGPEACPVAVKGHLEPLLPIPRLVRGDEGWRWDHDHPQLIGRVRAFHGNFGVLVRAPAYILTHGAEGLRQATLGGIMNASYVRKRLEPYYDLPHAEPTKHECVFSHSRHVRHGVGIMNIARHLIDLSFQPYTMSFPLIMAGAMMNEPTETESRHQVDLFIDALIAIARDGAQNPGLVKTAPHSTGVGRVDEVTAARVLRWRPDPVAP